MPSVRALLLAWLLLACLTDAVSEGAIKHTSQPDRLRGATVIAHSETRNPARRTLSVAAAEKHVHAALQSYFSNSELESHMRGYVQRCSSISRMFSIGQSALGAEMWALEISTAPGKEEAKPNFRYVANMHGDEPTGRQLQLAFAEWLCAHWETDANAGQIVKHMHLYLLPTMNPDGFAAKQRGNSAHVDLNRDFPDPLFLGEDNLTATGKEQPETLAIMKWAKSTRFVGSASMHEGAVVANYPWDGSANRSTSYSACPDDAAFIHLAKAYSLSHGRMGQSTEFKDGITNGAAWYPLWGGMQDWNYLAAGCMELTLELSQNKWPPAEDLPRMWQDNQPAMVNLALTAAFGGLRGTVREGTGGYVSGRNTFVEDAPSRGKPLAAALVVGGIKHTITASPSFGDFYRPLAPGSYNVTVTMKGYNPQTAEFKVLADNFGAVIDFQIASQADMQDISLSKPRKVGPFYGEGDLLPSKDQSQEVKGDLPGRWNPVMAVLVGVPVLVAIVFLAARVIRRRGILRTARSPPR